MSQLVRHHMYFSDIVPGRMTLLVTVFLVLVNIFNTITTNIPKARTFEDIMIFLHVLTFPVVPILYGMVKKVGIKLSELDPQLGTSVLVGRGSDRHRGLGHRVRPLRLRGPHRVRRTPPQDEARHHEVSLNGRSSHRLSLWLWTYGCLRIYSWFGAGIGYTQYDEHGTAQLF